MAQKSKARHSQASDLKGTSKILRGASRKRGACESLRLSPCDLVQPDGWARGEREGYGGPCDVTSVSPSLSFWIQVGYT